MENWLKMQDKMNWKMDGGEMCACVCACVNSLTPQHRNHHTKKLEKIFKCRVCVIKKRELYEKLKGYIKSCLYERKENEIHCHFF